MNCGITFTRYVKALAIAGAGGEPGAIAFASSQNWSNAREVIRSLEAKLAAVTPIGTNDMPPPTPAEFDFAEYVRPLSIIGRLVGLRRHPARVRTIAVTSGSGASWSGERNPRPLSRLTLAGSTLEQLSVIAIAVVTRELITSAKPAAENLLMRDLGAAAAEAIDRAFIDVTNLGVVGIMPAAITNGVTSIHSSGSTLAQIDSDLAILIQALADAGSDLRFATWVMRPRTWVYLKGLRGSGGALAYPGLTSVRDGGELAGFQVVVSSASHSDVGSPAEGGTITLLDPSQIIVADDNNSALEISGQTALAMADNPSSPSTMVSMYQTNSVALKTTRYLNWQRCRAGMAQVLDQVAY